MGTRYENGLSYQSGQRVDFPNIGLSAAFVATAEKLSAHTGKDVANHILESALKSEVNDIIGFNHTSPFIVYLS